MPPLGGCERGRNPACGKGRTRKPEKSSSYREDLPRHLKQSELFREAGEYLTPWHVRCCSSEPGDPRLDAGVFLKRAELGTSGISDTAETGAVPAIELADAKTTVGILGIRLIYDNDKPEIYKRLLQRPDYKLQVSRGTRRRASTSSRRDDIRRQRTYRFSDRQVMKIPARAVDGRRRGAWAREKVKPEYADDILHRWLRNLPFHANHDAEFLFEVACFSRTWATKARRVRRPRLGQRRNTPWQPGRRAHHS
ncbi:uncharacterized protein F4812DRAFT_466142 [Daldinia caldariorum]|uniref:uncharacterized protein n=1 Tax=Daldinia caldariorum TaxID=326644 RepID=UPI002007341B|nr:uncharacterized protein F4812DRAFT_466142 [Daldinia caldariorum]KAI1465667.1 hypothetical protein F4812DRAFT_466142 [Daldinia caldariorum]